LSCIFAIFKRIEGYGNWNPVVWWTNMKNLDQLWISCLWMHFFLNFLKETCWMSMDVWLWIVVEYLHHSLMLVAWFDVSIWWWTQRRVPFTRLDASDAWPPNFRTWISYLLDVGIGLWFLGGTRFCDQILSSLR
jgi:hypothetical protein